MEPPLLSIVIANYNYGRFIGEAIRSVVEQDGFDKCELIVVDGGSTDDSVEVVKKYADKITWWCSEKDSGQSDAFNKGFSHASGRFLTWLNADDVMLPGTIDKLLIAVEKHPECEWFVGGSIWTGKNLDIQQCHPARSFSRVRCRHGFVNVWGPSSFFTRELYDRVGGVDERFHYKMDTHLWLKFAKRARAIYRPFIRYAYGLRMHPDAKMSGHNFSDDSNTEKGQARYRQLSTEESILRDEFAVKRMSYGIYLATLDWRAVLIGKIDELKLKLRGKMWISK